MIYKTTFKIRLFLLCIIKYSTLIIILLLSIIFPSAISAASDIYFCLASKIEPSICIQSLKF